MPASREKNRIQKYASLPHSSDRTIYLDPRRVSSVPFPFVAFVAHSSLPPSCYSILKNINMSSGGAFGRLEPENLEQIGKYLKFFRQKKDALIRTVMRELDDMKRDRLESDDHMYNKEDMEMFAETIIHNMRGHLNSDLGTIINMGALSISQLLEAAQDNNIILELETAAVENVSLLDSIERISLDALPRTGGGKLGKLTSLKDEARAQKDAIDAEKELNKKLQDDNAALQRKLAVSRRNKAEGKESEEALEEALREAKDENDKRVRETNQFMTMKKLMQSQAGTIRDLRARLEHFEPSNDADCKEED